MKKYLLTPFFVFTLFASLVSADDLKEAQEAMAKEDYQTAIRLLKPLAEEGNSEAIMILAYNYMNGNGVTQDYQEAIQYFLVLSEQQGPLSQMAQINLGALYENGKGVAQDYNESFKWYKLAAEQEGKAAPMAQFLLFSFYKNGKGVPQSNLEALKWLKLSAENGFPIAQETLGQMYAQGEMNLEQNFHKAVQWYKLGAEGGHYWAQYNLGVAYYLGKGVEIDFITSFMWFLIAEKNNTKKGDDEAFILKGKNLVKGQLSDEQITEANKLADAWIVKHPNNQLK